MFFIVLNETIYHIILLSRRALRDMKLTNAEAQTDHIATVLVRDIEVNVQDDLLHRCDKAISTCDIFKHTPENLGCKLLQV